MRSANPSNFSRENTSCLPRWVLYHVLIFYVNQTDSVLNFIRVQTPADDTCVYWNVYWNTVICRNFRATFLSLSGEKKATSAGLKWLRRSRRPLAYSPPSTSDYDAWPTSHNASSFYEVKWSLLWYFSNCWDIFWTLTPNCDIDLEFGHINIMCDILSNYSLPFCFVWRNLLPQVLSNHREKILLPTPDCGLDLEYGNLTLVCDTPSNYTLSFGLFFKFAWVDFSYYPDLILGAIWPLTWLLPWPWA